MLILSRKLNESIVIDGRITVTILRVDGEVVKLGIAAPATVPVHRQEVYDEIRKSNLEALRQLTDTVPRLSSHAASPKVHPPNGNPLPGQPHQYSPPANPKSNLTKIHSAHSSQASSVQVSTNPVNANQV